jgi:hypothetical protein
MDEKRLPSPLDEALAQVDPDRRKFLGMLLAGVATAPLLTSAALAAGQKKPAEDKHSEQKADTWVKGSMTVKSNQTIKGESDKSHVGGSKSDIKYWDKTSGSSKAHTVKGSQDIKLNSVSPAIKGETHAIKGENPAIKGESPAVKLQPTAIKGETKPTPQ